MDSTSEHRFLRCQFAQPRRGPDRTSSHKSRRPPPFPQLLLRGSEHVASLQLPQTTHTQTQILRRRLHHQTNSPPPPPRPSPAARTRQIDWSRLAVTLAPSPAGSAAFLAFVAGLHFWNGQYYCRMAVANYHATLARTAEPPPAPKRSD